MKAFLRICRCLIGIAMIALVASCGAVTETGNPIPGGTGEPFAEPEDEATSVPAYTNDTYGVQIRYPAGWIFEEAADQSFVTFTSPDEDEEGTTSAIISFELLDPAPASLIAYLFAQYPAQTFVAFGTPTLSGYLYDNPALGPDGGDLRDYYFLDVDLLVHVDAEVFPATNAAFISLLEGITFL